jgi:methionyl-tRNA formyltransferase
MGTPEFAVASLDALVKAGFEIVAVITAPDKPAGRGMKLQESAVKQYAIEQSLLVLQPEKLKDSAFIEQLKSIKADIQVVVAFRMLPEIVWNMPPMGTINVHGSLLPKYRGAAPINWAIINGEKETGVTTFKLKHAIDTGNILMQEVIQIGDDENAGSLHDKMKATGAALLVKTLHGLKEGSLEEKDQSILETGIDTPHATKIFTETCRINWNDDVSRIHNLVRGLSPFPGAFSSLDGKLLKIFSSEKELAEHDDPAGKVRSDGKSYLKFACKGGYIHVSELQLEGKKKMHAVDFLRGYRLSDPAFNS